MALFVTATPSRIRHVPAHEQGRGGYNLRLAVRAGIMPNAF